MGFLLDHLDIPIKKKETEHQPLPHIINKNELKLNIDLSIKTKYYKTLETIKRNLCDLRIHKDSLDRTHIRKGMNHISSMNHIRN